MKKITKTLAMGIIALTLLFTGCKKDPGPAGPQGPAGANGNANVQSTTFMNQGFYYVSANNDYELNLSIPSISQGVLDKGAIMVYFQTSANSSTWIPLPFSYGNINITYGVQLSNINVVSTNSSTAFFNFRVVVIPAAMKKPSVDHSNYNEVKAAYNL